jgi:hypothetical protein
MTQISPVLLLLSLLAAHDPSSASDAEAPRKPGHALTLRPYTHCDGFAGGVRGVTLDRRPPNVVPWREIVFGDKTERVSVVDGYRVMYSYARTYPFANLKAERSEPSRYHEDKRIVTEHFVSIAEADGNAALASFSDRGFSGQTLTKNQLGGRTLGITQIFSDDDSVIVTIYFLNQAPENRRFQTHEEFISIRDSFVRGYLECVAKKRSTPIPG